MRSGWMVIFSLPMVAVGYETTPTFDAARAVLEVRCLECHTEDKAKGALILTTRGGMLKGGDGGASLVPGDADGSSLVKRVCLDVDDDDHMPPKKSGDALTAEDISALKEWIAAGAPWPDGEVLAPKAKTALPRWDAPVDPRIVSIEAFPKVVSLETAADFQRVIVIARFQDQSTHDITAQSKVTLADPSIATLSGTSLTPKKP